MTYLRIFLSTMTLLLVATLVQPVFAIASEATVASTAEIEALNDRIAEKKKKIKQLEKSIQSYKDKIAKKRSESVSLANQMSILDNRIIQVELDIETTNEKLETIQLEIQSLELVIDEKGATIEKQKALLAEFIRNIHQEGEKDFIEILANYENFSDFYNTLQYTKTIEQDLGKNARALRIAKEELNDKAELAVERKESYDALNERLNERKKDLNEQVYAKQNLLTQTQASELQYKTLLGSLKSQYQAIEGEISSIEREVRRKLEAQDKLDGPRVDFDGKLSWPSNSRYVTAYFFDKEYPYRNIFEHNAIDIRASHGTPIRAAASGYIGRAKHCSTASCYAYVMIIHSGGLSTVYGHLSKITVGADQFVARGDVIGYSGATPGTVGAGPFTTGPHLHFEVRKDGIPVNPLNYLVKDWD